VAGKVAPAKAEIRREVLAARDALTAASRADLSARIGAKLLALDDWRRASCVLAYMSFGSEFDTGALLEDLHASGRRICLPRLDRETRSLKIHYVENLGDDLQSGVWGIREPRVGSPRAELAQIDLVLVPGVAFSPACGRLGYGAGYYDRLIASLPVRPPLLAAAFELQIRGEIPMLPHDQHVDVVVTEITYYRRERKSSSE
jgi:5,10-methenyltetrahydrofolate synthetase